MYDFRYQPQVEPLSRIPHCTLRTSVLSMAGVKRPSPSMSGAIACEPRSTRIVSGSGRVSSFATVYRFGGMLPSWAFAMML